MPIPESQLQTWGKLPGSASASNTYNSIIEALGRATWPAGCTPVIHLQGSYRNSTNIYAESDVDVVVYFDNAYIGDTSALAPNEFQAYQNDFVPAQYTQQAAHDDTVAALNKYYGSGRVHPGNKAILVDTPYRPADVVVAIQHRKYSRYISVGQQYFEPGISLWAREEKRWVTNFPKQHYKNGVAKQSRTNDLYKTAVRIFKNANRYMVDRKMLDQDIAPSYGIECLVYSAPDDKFSDSLQDTFCGVLNWALSNILVIRRVSEQGAAVGDGVGLWQTAACQRYIYGLVDLCVNLHLILTQSFHRILTHLITA